MKVNLIAVMILTALVCACNSNNKNAGNDTSCKTSQSLSVSDGAMLSYLDCGQGDVTLLFVHGWNLNKNYWSNQIDQFSGDYRIVAIDLPGFGGSSLGNDAYSMDAYADALKSLMDQLELKNVVLVGHSMGGRVVLETAQQNDRVIALVGVDNFKDSGQVLNEELQAEVDGWLNWLRQDFSTNSPFYASQNLLHEETDSLVRNRIISDYASANVDQSISALQAYLSYPYAESERLSNLNIPLYLLSSDSSPVDTMSLDKTGLEYKVYEIGKTGHFPMVERPDVFNQHFGEILTIIKEKGPKFTLSN